MAIYEPPPPAPIPEWMVRRWIVEFALELLVEKLGLTPPGDTG